MKNCKAVIISGLLMMCISGVSLAVDMELEDIVITPSRIGEPLGESARLVDVIKSRDLRYANPSDISEALQYTPAVKIDNYGGSGALKTITMRGSTASQVLILLDGRPLNSPRSGDVSLSTIPLENVERIEVMRGPGSAIYGSNAMGGVVNILTKDIPPDGQKFEITSSVGTFRSYQEHLYYGTKLKNFGYRITAGYQSSEGHRDNAEYNAKDLNGKLVYEFNPENKLTLNAGAYKDKLGAPGSILSPDLNDKQLNRKNFFDLNWDVKPWADMEFEVLSRIYQDYDRLEFIETPQPLDKTTHTTKSLGTSLRFKQKISPSYTAIYGFDWAGHSNDSTATAKHEYVARAGYLKNQLDLFENFKIDLGARVDDYSNFGSEISPSADFLYRLKGGIGLHLLIARSFRAPTFNDLFWPADGFSEGNPNLQPEKGLTGEFGIEKKFSSGLKAALTYFRSDYDKLIKWQEDSDTVWRPKNIDSAIINGIEQTVEMELLERLSVKIDYAYLRAKDEKTHKFLTYQPKHKSGLSIDYRGAKGYNLGATGQFVDRSFANTANTLYIKRYVTVDLRFSKEFNEHSELFFNIYNILNRKYQTRSGYPLPGFSSKCGLRIKF
jgi:outer membrane receptor for ferrienterochelin and colicins